MTLNPSLDSYNYSKINNPNSRNYVLNLLTEQNLIDLYRNCYPNTKRYTWRRKNPIKQARLDYFIVSSTFIDLITSVNIRPAYRSDHSMIEFTFLLSSFIKGKGTWKLNTSFLKDKTYHTLINKSIKDEYVKYALPVYALDFLESVPIKDIQLTVDHELFLELLLLRIRWESIKYSTNKK